MLHRNLQAAPAPFLQAIAPYREDLVVCGACICTWDWLADLCAQAGIPFVLGHALYMNAMHGGKAKNEKIDSHKLALGLRGGMVPQADGYPAEMRATRAWLRRRMHLPRQRAELLAHLPQTKSPYHRPEIGTQLADNANREGVAARLLEPAVQKSLEVDLTLIGHDDRLLTDWELELVQTAKAHDAPTCYRLRSIPGVGKIWALGLLSAIHDIRRLPRVQECVSSGRLVQWANESAGTRSGPSGKKIGKASRTWAFSEAAGLFLRNKPAGQKSLARLAKNHGKGKALTT